MGRVLNRVGFFRVGSGFFGFGSGRVGVSKTWQYNLYVTRSGFFGFSGRVFSGFGFGSGRVGILNPIENSRK